MHIAILAFQGFNEIVSPSLNLVSARRVGPGFAELRYEVVRPAMPRAPN